MEKNKQSLQLSRTALTITLFIWFPSLNNLLGLYLLPISNILNILNPNYIKYYYFLWKRYEQDDFFGMILITLLSYIFLVIIITFIAPFLFYLFDYNSLFHKLSFNTCLFNI